MTTRIQRKRTKGWRLPSGAVCITRPGIFGNPFSVNDARFWCPPNTSPQQAVVDAYRWWLMLDNGETVQRAKETLARKALACFCSLDEPCHGDVLVEAAEDRLWRGWYQHGGKLIRVRVVHTNVEVRASGKTETYRYGATAFELPMPVSSSYRRSYSDPVPRLMITGRTVLGEWPTEQAAYEAALDMIGGEGQPRVCTPRDIDKVRRDIANAQSTSIGVER